MYLCAVMTERQRYPIGIQTFEKIREGNYAYVDKTGYVYDLAHSFQFVFLSRPRRFGKSLLVSTMKSYFEGRRDLFEGLAVSRLETEWRQHPVLHISLASAKGGTIQNLQEMAGLQLEWLEKKYGIECTKEGLGARLETLIKGCAEKYGEKVVVLIDEYDAPLLTVLHKPELLDEMRQALRAFYSPLKDCDPWLRFVFITGISKFSQLSIFSELNTLRRISMEPRYSAICGISEQELHEQWDEPVARMAEMMGVEKDEAYRQLKEKYDGYHFAEDLTDVYNPFSLLNALIDGRVRDHWFETGTPTVLVKMLQKFQTDITQLDGSKARSEEFDAPTEQMQSVLPLFYQSGYLTVKDYDRELDAYTLGLPNSEVRKGFADCLYQYIANKQDTDDRERSDLQRAYRRFRRDDVLEPFVQALQVFFASVPYHLDNRNEHHYHSLLYTLLMAFGADVRAEEPTAKGRADLVLLMPKCIYVMELKYDGTAEEALEQIDRKGYAEKYALDCRPVTKVGIAFSSEERNITEWKSKTV